MRITVWGVEAALDQHFLDGRFPQPLGAIGSMAEKMQVRDRLDAVQRRERCEDKVQRRLRLMQDAE